MKFLTASDPIILEIARKLRIDTDRCLGFEMRCYPDELVWLKVEMPASCTDEEPIELKSITTSYRLVHVEMNPEEEAAKKAPEGFLRALREKVLDRLFGYH